MAAAPQPPPMPRAIIPKGVPPGLEFLLPTNQIIVQENRNRGLFSTSEKQYNIMDARNQRLYFATETSYSACGSRGQYRNWAISIFNCMGQPVINGNRTGGTCDTNQVFVNSFGGVNLGGIVQQPGCCINSWNIVDGSGIPVLFLDGPPGGLFSEREFPITTFQEPRRHVGKITKKFTGMFAMQDVFGVDFPFDLDVKLKAVLIYAAFLIDFQYYENYGNSNDSHRR